MWYIKDVILVVASVVLAFAGAVNLYGLVTDWNDLQRKVYQRYGLTWEQLIFAITTIAFVVVAGKLILRVNRYESTAPLKRAKQQLRQYAANALAYSQNPIIDHPTIEQFLNDAGQKVTELVGKYEGLQFKEMIANFLDPEVQVPGNRHSEALRAAAAHLNGYANRLTTEGLIEERIA